MRSSLGSQGTSADTLMLLPARSVVMASFLALGLPFRLGLTSKTMSSTAARTSSGSPAQQIYESTITAA